jgi:hypothetical protein
VYVGSQSASCELSIARRRRSMAAPWSSSCPAGTGGGAGPRTNEETTTRAVLPCSREST